MIRRSLALLLFVCVSTASAYAGIGGFSKAQDFRPATPEELAMKNAPGDPGADAAILDWVRTDDDSIALSAEYYRIKIFTEAGKDQADIEIPYSPGYPLYTKIQEISARTIRPDGTIVPFDGKVFDKVLYKGRRSSLRAKTFTFKDVQPGSIIEYRYIRRWTENYLLNTVWSVQRDIPVVHSKFTLKPADTEGQFGAFFTYLGLPPGKEPKKVGRDRFELELENMPALRNESFMPPEEQMRARVNFFYTDTTVSLDRYWPAQAKTFADEIERFIGRGGKNTATELANGTTDRAALLRKIYAHTQSLRNLSYEASKTEQEMKKQDIVFARNAEDVLRKGSGFAFELNRAFVAVARQAGFEADAVKVAPRDRFFFSDKFPDAEQMSGEVALVTLDGKQIWLDPGTPLAPFGVVSWEKTNTASIQVSKGAKPTWGRVPANTPEEAVTKRVADLRLNDETLEGTITVTFSGQEALVRRVANITEDEAAKKKAIEDEVKAWFPDGSTLELTSLTGLDRGDADLTAVYKVSLPNVVSKAGSKTMLPIAIFQTNNKNPFSATTRKHPIYFEYPSVERDEVKLTLPAGISTSALPQPTDIDAGAFKFQSTIKRDGEVVTLTRSSQVNVLMVNTEHYNSLRQFFGAITATDQQPLVLVAAGGAK